MSIGIDKRRRTLQGRFIAFVSLLIVSVILGFTLLLIVLGITGSGRQAVTDYLEGELQHIAATAEEDIGNLAVTGIDLAEQLSRDTERIAQTMGLPLRELIDSRDTTLLSSYMASLLGVAEQTPCGGVFVVLDSFCEHNKMPGLFIKKTQPVSSASLKAKIYCLRGNADVARNHDVSLLGQWQMDYDSMELPFFDAVLAGARNAPDLPISRLYYWSGRVRLNGNSETGILLCLPLRDDTGDVFGICGIEVSDRMFKQLYSPGDSTYQSVFAMVAPRAGLMLHSERGLIAGNSYLTASQLDAPLTVTEHEENIIFFDSADTSFGGVATQLKMYPSGSPYREESWIMAVLMPRNMLENAIRGRSAALFFIVAGSLAVSMVGCVFISRRYLHPIRRGLHSIRQGAYEHGTVDFGVAEIDDLFAELSQNVRDQRAEVESLRQEHRDAKARMEKAQTQLNRLAGKKKQEIDPEEFKLFLENLKNLTSTETRIFELYLEGCTPKEIMERLQIKENTLKYHNRNIYTKLGVDSRRHLLQYAALMVAPQR